MDGIHPNLTHLSVRTALRGGTADRDLYKSVTHSTSPQVPAVTPHSWDTPQPHFLQTQSNLWSLFKVQVWPRQARGYGCWTLPSACKEGQSPGTGTPAVSWQRPLLPGPTTPGEAGPAGRLWVTATPWSHGRGPRGRDREDPAPITWAFHSREGDGGIGAGTGPQGGITKHLLCDPTHQGGQLCPSRVLCVAIVCDGLKEVKNCWKRRETKRERQREEGRAGP
jgi:hypothetical protein